MGYDGVQAIPVWNLEINEATTSKILLSQGPWNAVPSLRAALKHETGSEGVPSMPQDWVVSPPYPVCQQMVERLNNAGIRRVYHHLGEGQLVEVHPSLDRDVDQIVQLCQQTGTRLVLDLHHLRRSYREDETGDLRNLEQHQYRMDHFPSPLWKKHDNVRQQEQEWCRVITELAPYVDVVHVQVWSPDNDSSPETPASFAADPLGCQTGRLLRSALQQIEAIDPHRELILVAEYNPGVKRLMMPQLSRRLAKGYLAAMRAIVEIATKRITKGCRG